MNDIAICYIVNEINDYAKVLHQFKIRKKSKSISIVQTMMKLAFIFTK